MNKKWSLNFLSAAFISSAMGATLDVNDPQSIAKAHEAAAANLITYYTPNGQGTIPPVESKGRDGFQWFEMGMLWGALMDYTAIRGDQQAFNIVAEALGNAGSGESASFIGPKTNGKWASFGRWNDDIGWWAFAATSGAEIKGPHSLMPNGVPFLSLVKNSWDQMNEGVNRNSSDEAICRGGLFWHRNRAADKPHLARLLSTVTTAQYIVLSIRLHELTGDHALIQAAKDAFDWIFEANLIGQNGEVYDGVYNPRCWQIEKKEHSYNSGLFLGAAAWLYKVTGDEQYLQRSRKVFARFKEVFTVDDIIIDICEPSQSCEVNQAAFKGIAIRGLSHYYRAVSDAETRNSIQNMIRKSAQGMAATCKDNWACNTLWTPGSPAYSDVHTQNTALELLNALSIISQPVESTRSFAKNSQQKQVIAEAIVPPSENVDAKQVVAETMVPSSENANAPNMKASNPDVDDAADHQKVDPPQSDETKPADSQDQNAESYGIPFNYAASTYPFGIIPLLIVYLFTC